MTQQTILHPCPYCGHTLRLGETVEPQPACEPTVMTGLICDWCPAVIAGPSREIWNADSARAQKR